MQTHILICLMLFLGFDSIYSYGQRTDTLLHNELMLEVGEDTAIIYSVLKNYCFFDTTCTGYVFSHPELHGCVDGLPIVVYKYKVEDYEEVQRLDIETASEQGIINQFFKATLIVNYYQRMTRDKTRVFPIEYFFMNIEKAPPMIGGRFDDGGDIVYPFKLENLSVLKNINFAGKLKPTFGNHSVRIQFTNNDSFSILTDSVFYERQLKWILSGVSIPPPSSDRNRN